MSYRLTVQVRQYPFTGETIEKVFERDAMPQRGDGISFIGVAGVEVGSVDHTDGGAQINTATIYANSVSMMTFCFLKKQGGWTSCR